MQTFAERLISLREDKGWKKKELAEKLHVSDSMISQYESGRCMTDSESGYSLSFTYSNGKVSRYQEVNNSGTGATVSVTYPDHSETVYRDHGADRVWRMDWWKKRS